MSWKITRYLVSSYEKGKAYFILTLLFYVILALSILAIILKKKALLFTGIAVCILLTIVTSFIIKKK
ncbi:MAG: hypothetical protein Q7S65_00310 [Nanoarchaeota archaeon]|nr:hypothetical protein [Nanoarchaeota archaeon]